MDTRVLETNLRKVVEDYKNATDAQFNEHSNTSATEADLAMLAQQTHFTLTEFEKAIVSYLKEI